MKCPKCGFETKQRSLNENNYYFGVVVALISEYTGFTPTETHEALKWRFLRLVRGKLETCRSTTDLSVAEFETYLSQIRIWASEELGIFIPLPNEIVI